MTFPLAAAAAAHPAPRYVWGSLLPIVAGCSLSAMKEVSFSWGGFNNAMISNVGMVLRNIYSKKSLNDYKVGVGTVRLP
jgi:solute carrier family 35 protein E1